MFCAFLIPAPTEYSAACLDKDIFLSSGLVCSFEEKKGVGTVQRQEKKKKPSPVYLAYGLRVHTTACFCRPQLPLQVVPWQHLELLRSRQPETRTFSMRLMHLMVYYYYYQHVVRRAVAVGAEGRQHGDRVSQAMLLHFFLASHLHDFPLSRQKQHCQWHLPLQV